MASFPSPPPPPPPPQPQPPPAPTCEVCPPVAHVSDQQRIGDLQSSASEAKKTVESLPLWRLQSPDKPRIRWLACNRQIKHISQQGPTCGLVALCMAASMLNMPVKTLEVVLTAAREKGYTVHGEMFSASNTVKLAEEEFDMSGHLFNDGLMAHIVDIISHLANGLPVLVPYDKDSNNEPAMRKGHSAHWAVLTGFVIVLPEDVDIPPYYHDDTASSNFTHLPPPWSADLISILPHLLEEASQIFVFGRQGKSRLLGAWEYDTLATSNRNLVEYDPKLEGDYVFQEEGLAAGLAGKAILLNKRDC